MTVSLKVFGKINIGNLFFHYLFKNRTFYANSSVRYCFHSGLIQSNSYCTRTQEDKSFPLLEIKNLNHREFNVDEDKLSILSSEIEYAKLRGRKLPEFIKLSDVYDILECETISQRNKYLTFLFKKEMKKLKEAMKRKEKKVESERKSINSFSDANHIQYGLGKNILILRTRRRSVMKYYDLRLASSALFSQKIVIDMGYDQLMTKKERKGCASQLRLLYGDNRLSQDPFDLYFCNASSSSRCVQYLKQEMPNIDESLITLTEQSYLDLFPRESLVYLSPHAKETLKNYDHKAVYIIGGFVDTVKRDNISSFKAEEDGIKSYSLPLDEYILWGTGSRSLAINHVFSILQTMRNTGDWREALKHVPTRKLRRLYPDSVEAHYCSDRMYVLNDK